MLKVLHVVYGDTGGAARIVLDIAKNHDRMRFQPIVALIGYRVDENYIKELGQHGITAIKVLKKKKWDWGFLKQLRQVFKKQKPDVLLLHTPVAYFWGRLACFALGIKAVISVEHLAVKDYYGVLGRIINFLETHLLTDKVICVSDDVKDMVRTQLYIPDEKVTVIKNGIPVDRFTPVNPEALFTTTPIRITMVSRLDKQKDPITLIKAVKLLRQQNIKIKLDFVGDGELRPGMEKLTAELEVSNSVSFLGMRSDIMNLLHNTDIFVLSTHREGLPIALLEAMASGLPCIATAVPGNLGVVMDGRTGLLVPENDEIALSEAILRLIKEPGLARRLGIRARENLEKKYSIVRTVKEYETVFDEMLGISDKIMGMGGRI